MAVSPTRCGSGIQVLAQVTSTSASLDGVMQAVARDAIVGYVYDRPARLRALTDEIIGEDQELLDRLAQ